MNHDGRKRDSRSFEIIVGLINSISKDQGLDVLDKYINHIYSNPEGGCFKIGDTDTFFLYGDIGSLRMYLKSGLNQLKKSPNLYISSNKISTLSNSKLVWHTDFKISDDVIRSVPVTYIEKVLYYIKNKSDIGKADILIFELNSENINAISVKTYSDKKEVKLSQQSQEVTYDFKPHSVSLVGGVGKDAKAFIENICVDDIVPENTLLSDRQFYKLSLMNKKFAVAKNKNPNEWERLCKEIELDAYRQLEIFRNGFVAKKYAGDNTKELILKRLIGEQFSKSHINYYMTGFNKIINVSKFFDNTSWVNDISETFGEFRPSSNGKLSLVLYCFVGEKKYVLTKIEPSFDGYQPDVSQTKGIVYYFQEGKVIGIPTIWNLINDLYEKNY